jgi:hypothetical protein
MPPAGRQLSRAPSSPPGSAEASRWSHTAIGRQREVIRPPVVVVVEPAEMRERDDVARIWWLNGSWSRALPGQRQMRSRRVIVRHVGAKDATQMSFVENDVVVEALSPNRSTARRRDSGRGCALQAHEVQSPVMATATKPNQQSRTESCVVSGNGQCEA